MSNLIRSNKKLFVNSGGVLDPSIKPRIENLENNEYKILYFQTISSTTGTITKPTNSTILLDQFYSGGDAIVETLVNGQPSGQSPLTAGGSVVSVSSFDASGNFTLSGTPSSYPVALIYIFTIKAVDYSNVVKANEMNMENNSLAPLASPTFTGVATFQNIIRLTSASLGTAVAGNVEFLTDKFYGVITTGTARKEFALIDSSLTNTGIVYTNSSGRLATSGTTGVVTNGSSISIGALAAGGYNGSYGAYNSRHGGTSINRASVAEHANASGYLVNELRGVNGSSSANPVFWNAVYSYITAGNYSGTSIPVANTCLINASQSSYASAGTATGILVSAALTHYILAGTTGANVGLVHGSTGIRIDTINALHNALSSGVSLHINTGILRYSSRQIGNAGLSSGDIYVDTAANILAAGDYVMAMKA